MAQPENVGRYKIVAELGHGAMGAVYRATDPMMDRTVAIKTILAGALAGPQSQEYRDRFVREARAAGRLQHPGIVTVYDVGEADGIPYLVMEFVNGRTLATAMESGERFSFDRVYELGYQIADALGYAHRHGVVHRDIKPANILLALEGEGIERAKIADLGVAKLAASQITTTGQLLGTPAFMPPEQFTGAPLDGRADIFSLGVILYWLATGDKPFGGDTITAVSYKVVHSLPAPPRRINPAVPVQMERVIMRCLEKDPAQRYAMAEQLAADLAAARAGREVSATSTNTSASGAAAQTAMTPVAVMDGDPNTTLDSSVRLEMSQRAAPMQASAISSAATEIMLTPTPPRPAKSGTAFSGRTITAAVVILVLMTWAYLRHRKNAALADQAAHQAATQVVQVASPTPPSPTPADTGAASQSSTAIPSGTDPAATKGNATPLTTVAGSGNGSGSSSQPNGNGSGTAGAGAGAGTSPNSASTKSASNPPSAKTPGRGAPNLTGIKTAGSNASAQQNKQAIGPAAPPTSALPLPPSASPGAGASNPASQILEKAPIASPTASNTNGGAQPTAAAPKPTGADAENAGRLHIDDGRVPNAIGFLVLLDGKMLLQRGVLAEGQNSPARDDQLIPPGEHELKVVAVSGGVAIGASNTVRQEFKTKKKKNLRIELRDNSSGQAVKKTAKVDSNSSTFVIELRDAGGFLGVH